MEKGLARFRVSLLCFCCDWFCCGCLLRLVWSAVLLRLLWSAEVADSRRRSFPLRGPLLFGSQCRLQLSATSALPVLQPRPGSVPFSGANASCSCLPPQHRRYSNRVLVQCPVGSQCLLQLSATSALPGTPTASWHRDHAHKYSRGILAWRRGHLSTLWHGDPAYKGLSAIPACQSISQPTSNRSHPSIPPDPRHGDPTHNALSATPACQSGHLSTLWHGDHQQNHFWGRVKWQDCLEPVSNRSLADA